MESDRSGFKFWSSHPVKTQTDLDLDLILFCGNNRFLINTLWLMFCQSMPRIVDHQWLGERGAI